jgi:NAD(P)H dehydrogenase (quinone)
VAEAAKKGIVEAGGDATIYQCVFSLEAPRPCLTRLFRIAETLPQEILTKMHAPAKPDYPVIQPDELVNFDAYLFGIPTRYGNFPAQWKVRISLVLSGC